MFFSPNNKIQSISTELTMEQENQELLSAEVKQKGEGAESRMENTTPPPKSELAE